PVLGLLAGIGLVVAVALIAASRLRRRPPRPTDPRLAELERALRRSGRRADAGTTLRRLERAFQAEPDAVAYVRALREARYGFGRSLQQLGRHAEARKPLTLAACMRPERGDYKLYRDRSRRAA